MSRSTGRPPDARSASGDAEWRWLRAALGDGPVPPFLIVIGLGDGAVLDTLERHAPGTRVLALEPDAAAARRFAASAAGERWRRDGRLVYLIDPGYAGADDSWRAFPESAGQPPVLVHPAVTRGPGLERAKGTLKKILFGVRANAAARRKFAPRYLVNTIRNVPAMAAGTDVRALSGAYRGVPAVIAAAGPSLDRSLDDLRALRHRALLIACDTALRPLLLAGIAPPLVVGADPSPANARHFHSLPACPDTWLVSESALDRTATAPFDGRTFWFRLAHHHPWPWLNEVGLDVGVLEMWGSVLTAAFQVACLAGCDPIVLVGADLAFTDGRPYARGTTYELEWAHAAARGVPLETSWRRRITRTKPQLATDLRGVETATTSTLLAFRDWMVTRAARSGRRVVNATGAGMLFGNGVEQGALHDLVREPCSIPSIDSIARRSAESLRSGDPIDGHAIAARTRTVRRMLGDGAPTEAPVAQWAAFAGDGFDTAAMGAALDGTTEALERERPWGPQGDPGAADPLRPETSATAFSAATQLVMRMPEAMTRLRSALNGQTLPELGPAIHAHDRAALLLEAAVLLHRICELAASCEDLAPIVPPTRKGHLPVSAQFAWPDHVRWAVQGFESLLGVAWASMTPTRGSAFLTRVANRRIVPGRAPERPAVRTRAIEACTRLLLQWLQCALTPVDAARTPSQRPIDRGGAIDREDSASGQCELPLASFDEPALARLLTGVVQDDRDAACSRPLIETGAFHVTIGRRPRCPSDVPAHGTFTPAPFVAPRVLTDEGVPPGHVHYSGAHGAICGSPHRRDTFVVREDGSSAPHRLWPKPITRELPLGADGAVAWSDGLSTWPAVEPAYVMFKGHRGADVEVQSLPVRPTYGTWWNGRLYWVCAPRVGGDWAGVASWAPGEDVRLDIPDLVNIIGLHADQRGLVLESGSGWAPGGKWVRRFSRDGWVWRRETGLTPIALGAYGASSSRATSRGLTAVAYPDADLLTIQLPSGRVVSLTCYYPLHAAWLGTSLLVSTAGREILLFDRLGSLLDQR